MSVSSTFWRRRLSLAATLVGASMPAGLLACPICFGASDSPLAIGMNNGILALLGVTGLVLAGFAAFFISLMRRARAVSSARVEEPVKCTTF